MKREYTFEEVKKWKRMRENHKKIMSETHKDDKRVYFVDFKTGKYTVVKNELSFIEKD